MRRFESFIEVEAPVEWVFDLLADFESYPRWMGGVRDVRRTGRRTSHWIAETALDFDVEWDAETTHFEPDRRIVWRAFRGDVHADGEAVLSETEHGTTVVHYVLGYDTPAGRSGERAAPFFGEHPKRRLERDLARFKRLAEGAYRDRRGEGFTPRRFEGRRYEEGRGGSGAEIYADRPRHQRAGEDARERRREEPRAPSRTRRRIEEYGGDFREEGREEFRDRPRGDGADVRGRSFDELWRESRRERGERTEPYERERTREPREPERGRPLYALTPREREREREHEERATREREPERSEADWLERRGVDRLLEDPPSSRWRR